MELIPGLPDDLARECLSRVPYHHFPSVGSICKGWKAEIESSSFLSQRKSTGHSQALLVLAQNRPNPVSSKPGSPKHILPPICLPTVFEPMSGQWADLPPPPDCPDGLPRFCRLAAVGLDLVVIGGLDPVTWDVSSNVYVYNFMSATWRRGADMPCGPRLFFGCASNGDGTVFVAGGHDNNKNALRSAVAYDVGADRWVPMPDMVRERDECRGMFYGGKFVAVSGYATATQGKYERSVEEFDPATWQWGPVQENVLEADTCPRTCVEAAAGEDAAADLLYTCRNASADVAGLRRGPSSGWAAVAKLPAEVGSRNHVMRWREKVLVFGWGSGGDKGKSNDVVFVLDLCSGAWSKVPVPEEFSGAVMEGCVLEI